MLELTSATITNETETRSRSQLMMFCSSPSSTMRKSCFLRFVATPPLSSKTRTASCTNSVLETIRKGTRVWVNAKPGRNNRTRHRPALRLKETATHFPRYICPPTSPHPLGRKVLCTPTSVKRGIAVGEDIFDGRLASLLERTLAKRNFRTEPRAKDRPGGRTTEDRDRNRRKAYGLAPNRNTGMPVTGGHVLLPEGA